MKAYIRLFRRAFGVGILFIFLTGFILVAVYRINRPFFCDDVCYLENDMNRFMQTHGGRFPRSFREISTKADEIYGKHYVIVDSSSPVFCKFSYQGIYLVPRVPYRTGLPFPFGMSSECFRYVYHNRPEYVDHFESVFLSDVKSRELIKWISNNDNSDNSPTNNSFRSRVLASFIPDILYYIIISFVVYLFFRRSLRVAREEKLQCELLEKIYREIINFSARNDRFPISAEEIFLDDKFEKIKQDSKKYLHFLGAVPLKFNGSFVVACSSKSWLATTFPIWGGKRLYLLLDDGRVMKLKGASEVEGFCDRVNAGERYYKENAENKNENAKVAKNDSSWDLLSGGYFISKILPEIPSFLNVVGKGRGRRLTTAVTSLFLLNTVVLFIFFSPYFLSIARLSDFVEIHFALSYTIPALGVLIPYCFFISNYYAEY